MRAIVLLLLALVPFAPGSAAAPRQAQPAQRVEFDKAIGATKHAMLGDPVHAALFAHDAETVARGWPLGDARELGIATAQWLEGEAAFRANDVAKAEPLIAAALATAVRRAPGSKLNADLLLSRAEIAVQRGKPQDGLNDLQSAYRLFAALGDARSEAKALQSIGSIYQDAQDFNRVISYYKLANEIDPNDALLRLSASNNMANAYAQMGKLDEAENEFKRALVVARALKSDLLSARILDNIADLQIDKRKFAAARTTLASGITLASEPKASGWLPMLLGTKARLELAQGQPAVAVRDLEQAFSFSDDALVDQSYRSLHLTAYRAYKSVGDNKRALYHLEAFRRMDDEGRTLAASTNAALLAARFDFVNQNARIAGLKTGSLQRDVALTRLKARQSTITLGTLLALVTTAVIFLYVYLRALRSSRNKILAANEQLEKTNNDLAEALSVKSQFLATTSHEIRTPLNGILGMTQVMLADGTITGMQRERISLVDSAGRSMRSLVDDILDFAKMDSGVLDIDAVPVDLMAVLPDVVALWRLQAVDKGIKLDLDCEGIDERIVTDVGRLRQIVFNLLSNAIKFTSAGSVTVHAYAPSTDTLVIDVCDTGVGVPASAFDAIFEPFRQLDTSTTRQFGGTGLGLAISRHLARALGGDITIVSIVGTGSTFRLKIPYVRVPAIVKPEAILAATTPGGNRRRLLIVSTNPITRSLLRNSLAPFFSRCDASDVAKLGEVDARDFDVAMLDVEQLLANEDLLKDVLARTRERVPVVAVLCPAGSDPVAAFRFTADVDDVIVKPISAEDLGGRLSGLFASASNQRSVRAELKMA